MESSMKGMSPKLSSKSMQAKSNRPNLKISLLGGVITLLVLHGALRRTSVAPSPKPKPVVAIAWAEEETEKVDYWDPAVPFVLGPKISGWDQQRALWNRAHPGANVSRSGKSRAMLVSGSQPKPCATPMGNLQILKSFKNKADYCRLHDIELYYGVSHMEPHMTSFWAKMPLVRRLMLTHPEVEWFWWMDSDALITDMSKVIPFESYGQYNLVLNGKDEDVYVKKSWLGMNAGVYLIRNCQWALDLFDVWAPMGPEGPVRHAAGSFLAATLSDRPDFEADDQSALVHLLSTQRERWGDKVLLESDLGLFGYWYTIVDTFEDLMTKGEGSWPFVTHFVGCKPCGIKASNNYSLEMCLKGMDRAFNFADNQILKLYGFRHTTLNTHTINRVRMDTSDPLRLRHGSVNATLAN